MVRLRGTARKSGYGGKTEDDPQTRTRKQTKMGLKKQHLQILSGKKDKMKYK